LNPRLVLARIALQACAIGAALLFMIGQAAQADALSATNFDRMQGCGTKGAPAALQPSSKLALAARKLAAGAALQNALAGAQYLAAASAELHLTGPVSDLDVQHTLAAHYCHTLQDPQLKEFGAERQGRDLWIVLAAPVSLPAPGDAAKVSQRILELVNQARAVGRHCGSKSFGPVGPLTLDAALTRAALDHSRDMATHDEFEHRGHDGSTPAIRVERAGYGEHRIVGENIAAGAMNAGEVVAGWLASPEHCENIMDARFTQIGIAYAENLRSSSAVFWTQDFAAHR
jgi:uncharacterized protein YkwD